MLRGYQSELVESLRKALCINRKVIACAPTGSGKSTVAKAILSASSQREPTAKQSGLSLFAVHRRGLVDNIIDNFERDPVLDHGVVMSGRETDWSHRVQSASIDTLLSWHVEDGKYQSETTFDLVIYDECHAHSSKLKKWLVPHDVKRVLLGLAPAYVIGLSASPMAKGLSSIFDVIINGPSVRWLIDNGFLVPMSYFEAKHLGKLDLLKKSGDGFTAGSLEAAFDGLAGDLVEDWREKAEGRPTVGFFSRLSHAREAQQMLCKAGIAAEYVDGETPDDDRRRLFRGLDRGDFDYLCNVGIVDRGTDIPAVSCIQLATAVNSVVRLIQILGRGARPSEGKSDCVVIDHGGSICRLNTFFEDDIQWSLSAETNAQLKHEGRPVISCPACGVQYRGGSCRSCGYEPTPKERKSVGLEFADGELVEIKKKDKSQGKQKTCEQLMVSALYRAGKSGRTWRQACGIAKTMAEQQGTRFRVPARFKVGQDELLPIQFGDPEGKRKVKNLYDGRFA